VARLDSRGLLKRLVPRPARVALHASRSRVGLAQQWAFEHRLGARTSGHDYVEEDFGTERLFYEGCEWLPVRRALRRLGPGLQDVFVDLGSGKGQALLIAGRLRYGAVLGVEYAEDLHRAAEANIARARPRLRAREVRSVCADALQWPIPDDVSVVFLYSPFIGELFHDVMQRVFDSYDRAPRRLHLVYDFPWEHDWLMSTGRVRVVDAAPAQWPPTPWWWRTSWVVVTYEVVPAGTPPISRRPGRRRLLNPPRAFARWQVANRHRFMLYRPGHEPIWSRPADS
jgi:SAM-dependent methyltransferase